MYNDMGARGAFSAWGADANGKDVATGNKVDVGQLVGGIGTGIGGIATIIQSATAPKVAKYASDAAKFAAQGQQAQARMMADAAKYAAEAERYKAQGQASAANVAMQQALLLAKQAEGKDNTMLYVGLGLGAVVLLGAVFLLTAPKKGGKTVIGG